MDQAPRSPRLRFLGWSVYQQTQDEHQGRFYVCSDLEDRHTSKGIHRAGTAQRRVCGVPGCLCGWGSDLVGWPTGAPPNTVPSLTGLASLPLEELRILASGLDAT